MFKVLFDIPTKAKTVSGLNKAIEKHTGNTDWFEDKDDLEKAVREGFVEFQKNKVVIWYDGE